jgi:ribonuclease HI
MANPNLNMNRTFNNLKQKSKIKTLRTHKNPPSLKVIQINLRKSKIATAMLRTIVEQYNIDILIISEPYTYKNHFPIPKSWQTINYNENPLSSIIITNKNITACRITQFTNQHITTAEIIYQGTSFLFISLYFPPSISVVPLIDIIQSILNKYKQSNIILGGDTNCRSITWGNQHNDIRGKKFEELIINNNLKILNDGTSHTYENEKGQIGFMDLTLVNRRCSRLINSWSVLEENSLSDHRYILFSIQTYNTQQIKDTPKDQLNFDTRKANWQLFKSHLISSLTNKSILSCQNKEELETFVENLNNSVLIAANHAIPRKKIFKKSNPWWNDSLTIQRTTVRNLRRSYKRVRDPELRNCIKLEYSKILNNYKINIKISKEMSWQTACTTAFKKSPWNQIYKVLRGKYNQTQIHTFKDINNIFTNNTDETIQKLMSKFFPEDNTLEDNEIHKKIRQDNKTPYNELNDCPFTENEIRYTINSLNNKKSPGIDQINADIVKKTLEFTDSLLIDIYKKCLYLNTFPKIWKKAKIIILTKPGNSVLNSSNAFRPISLLTTFGKVLDQLLTKRLQFFLRTKLSPRQFGFIPQKCTEDAIQEVMKFVRDAKKEKQHCALITLDVSAAFDNAWHPIIINNLRNFRCPSNLLYLAESFLADRTASYSTKNHCSTRVIQKGCPQGSKLGPILWNILFDSILNTDLPPNTAIQAYADDTILLVKGKSKAQTKLQAQLAIESIIKLCDNAKVTFNPNKSEALYIKPSQKKKNKNYFHPIRAPTFYINKNIIKNVNKIRYLGITIDNELNWKEHISYICNKSKEILSNFSNITHNTWGINQKTLKMIYDCTIVPILTYASSIWYRSANHLKNQKRLLSIQRIVATKMCQSYITAPTTSILLISKLIPINHKITETARIYLTKKYFRDKETLKNMLQDDIHTTKIIKDTENIIADIDYTNIEHPSIRHTNPFNYIYLDATHKKQVDTDSNTIYVYTDGSKNKFQVGASFVIVYQQSMIYSQKLKLHQYATSFQAEITAIQYALIYINTHPLSLSYNNIQINTDNTSVIRIIQKFSYNPLVHEIRELLFKLSKKRTIGIAWVKSHSGDKWNELADQYAKKVAKESRPADNTMITISSVIKQIKLYSLEDWEISYDKTANMAIKEIFQSVNERLKSKHIFANKLTSQFLNEHGNFKKHQFRLKRIQSEYCPSCLNEIHDRKHVIYNCKIHDSLRNTLAQVITKSGKNWPIPLKELTLNPKFFAHLYKYLKSTKEFQ